MLSLGRWGCVEEWAKSHLKCPSNGEKCLVVVAPEASEGEERKRGDLVDEEALAPTEELLPTVAGPDCFRIKRGESVALLHLMLMILFLKLSAG